jgi:hypothetical protein
VSVKIGSKQAECCVEGEERRERERERERESKRRNGTKLTADLNIKDNKLVRETSGSDISNENLTTI